MPAVTTILAVTSLLAATAGAVEVRRASRKAEKETKRARGKSDREQEEIERDLALQEESSQKRLKRDRRRAAQKARTTTSGRASTITTGPLGLDDIENPPGQSTSGTKRTLGS